MSLCEACGGSSRLRIFKPQTGQRDGRRVLEFINQTEFDFTHDRVPEHHGTKAPSFVTVSHLMVSLSKGTRQLQLLSPLREPCEVSHFTDGETAVRKRSMTCPSTRRHEAAETKPSPGLSDSKFLTEAWLNAQGF